MGGLESLGCLTQNTSLHNGLIGRSIGIFSWIPNHPFSPSCTPARRGKGPCLLFSAMAEFSDLWSCYSTLIHLSTCCLRESLAHPSSIPPGTLWQPRSFLRSCCKPARTRVIIPAVGLFAMSSQGLWLCEAFLSVLVFWCYLASGPCCFVDPLKRVVVITGWITTGSLHW